MGIAALSFLFAYYQKTEDHFSFDTFQIASISRSLLVISERPPHLNQVICPSLIK